MANKLPLGVFSRGRRDMTLSRLAIGSVHQNGGNPIAVCYLGNTSAIGERLAVYGILAYRPAFPQLFAAWPLQGIVGGTPGSVIMLNPDAGQIVGKVTTANVSNPLGGVDPMQFKGDGSRWMTNGDLPLFIIPPNWSLVVQGAPQFGTIPVNEFMAVTFLWGIHHDARAPRLPKA